MLRIFSHVYLQPLMKVRSVVHFQPTFMLNHSHNILRLFDVQPNFPLTTSKLDGIVSNKYGMYKMPHELPNDLRLSTLGN